MTRRTVTGGAGYIREYYVIFCGGHEPEPRWFHRFLHKKFRHVYLATPIQGGDKTLLIEPLQWGVRVDEIAAPVDQYIQAAAEGRGNAILHYVAGNANIDRYIPRGLFTCVTAAKSLLAVEGARGVITPLALYKELLIRGATVIKPFAPYLRGF